MMFYIYGLIDPTTKELRYIGKTNNPKNRYNDHINKLGETNYKANWINGLLKNNLKPEMIILEEYKNENDCLEAEIFLIEYFRLIGSRLTNLTNGGEGMCGHVQSKETKIKRSKSLTGIKRSQATIEKNRKINKENPTRGMLNKHHSEETKINISLKLKDKYSMGKIISPTLGRKHSKEEIIKMSENSKNKKITDDDVIKIRELYATKNYTQRELSLMFNISNQHISDIINNKRRKL